MAIFLDNQTSSEIKRLLKKEILLNSHNFIAPRLLKMVESDDQRKLEISLCEHNYQPMYGFHEKCNLCTGLKDGFEEWVNEDRKSTLSPKGSLVQSQTEGDK